MDLIQNAQQVVKEHNTFAREREGLLICPVNDQQAGIELAKNILYKVVDKKTALFLSGGSTPKKLYELFASEEEIHPGVVGLIDERYGDPYHAESNEKMILQTGLVRYLAARDIQYYPILKGLPLGETADRYDELMRSLQTVIPKFVGILGIGKDGHTSSIAPNRTDFSNPMFDDEHKLNMVSYFYDESGPFKKRVGMTFLGLAMLDLSIILAFGTDKQRALTMMFEDGKEEDIPARFFCRTDIAPKTILITDLQSL